MPEESETKKAVLQANSDIKIFEDGVPQRCWGSDFIVREVENPELEAEFPDEDLPETMFILIGEFPEKVKNEKGKLIDNYEIESLLRSKRAVRYSE